MPSMARHYRRGFMPSMAWHYRALRSDQRLHPVQRFQRLLRRQLIRIDRLQRIQCC